MRLRHFLLLLNLLAATAPASGAPQYTITLLNAGEFYSATPFRQDAVTAIPISWGTGTYAGHAFAGPGWVNSFGHVDVIWSSVLSGGGGGLSRSRAQTDDFVISGPPGYVTGTLHWRLRATLGHDGGFAGHGAHQAQVTVYTMVNFATATGSVTDSNAGVFAAGVLSGYAGSDVDAPISITASFPVGVPLLVAMYVEAGGNTYGNIDVSPAWVECDAGGMSDALGGYGLRLEEVGGQVMTLPAGYTLSSASWGIVDNHFPTSTGVGSAAGELPGAVRFEVASENPARDGVRMLLSLDRASDVQVAVFDVSGRKLATLLDHRRGPGVQWIDWDGRYEGARRAPAGHYFVRATVDGRVFTRRFVLLR